MSQIVQARCPNCKNVLRIPSLWLQQPMRCKHCRQVFQAKTRAAAPASAGVAAAPGSENDFDFVQTAAPVRRSSYRSRRGRPHWLVPLFGFAVVAGAAAALIVFGPQLGEFFKAGGDTGHTPGAKPIAQNSQPGDPAHPGDRDIMPEPPGGKSPPAGGNENPPDGGTEPGPMSGTPPLAAPPDNGGKPPDTGVKPPPKPIKNPPEISYPQAVYPRRALAISVSEYLLANPLSYGSPLKVAADKKKVEYPGSNARAVLNALERMYMKFPTTQLFEISDAPKSDKGGAGSTVVPVKPVIEHSVTEFLKTSRPQDHLVVFFSGHLVKDDKDNVYLVPVEGDPEDSKTLIGLSWLFDKMKASPARQKVLILDVCRFNPARGNVRPGGDPLDEAIEKKLQAPPGGVQVWVSCSKDQQSIELADGSLFQEALCAAMWDRPDAKSKPNELLPLGDLVAKVNKYMETRLPSEFKQVSRLYGKAPLDGAAFDPDQTPAAKITLSPPPASGKFAGKAEIKSIVDEIEPEPKGKAFVKGKKVFKGLPPEAKKLVLEYPFPAKVLADYKTDGYTDEMEFLNKDKEFPLRAAVIRAKNLMVDVGEKFTIRESFTEKTTAQVKTKIKEDQEKPAKAKFFLEEAMEEMEAAKKFIKDEPSKRWQAHYHFTLAQLKARLIYVVEYDTILGQIRLDSLPELPKGASGYQVAAVEKLSTPKSGTKYVHDWNKQLKKDWQKIIDNYPDTPWALLARREKDAALGLEWRPIKN